MASTEPMLENASPFPPIVKPLTGDDCFKEEDPRHPGFYKWLSQDIVQKLGYAVYGIWAAFNALHLICSLAGVDDHSVPFLVIMFLPWVNCFIGVAMLVGTLSEINTRAKLGYIVATIPFVFVAIWPRLAVPMFGGWSAPFMIYMCLNHIYDHGLLQWTKYSIATYMTTIGPGIALFNCLLFKGWCAGYLPKIVYFNFTTVFMALGTVKEVKKAEEDKDTSGIDYAINIPTAKLLVPFRVAVLNIAIGVGMTFMQEAILGLLREDVWACTPLSF